jgi:hypothetical protein
MKPKYFILIGFTFVVAFFISYITMFFYQLKAPIPAEYWIDSTYKYKDYKAKTIKKKKIIIISGSNSLFGINSEKIHNITGFPVINLAVHAGLDIDFLYYKIKQYIKEGDIVVMPLEFGYYEKEKFTGWFSNNMMSWGNGYLKELSILDLLNFIITTEPDRVFEGVSKQIKTNGKNKKIIPKNKVVKTLEALWDKDGSRWRGYSYKSLNKDGDINANSEVKYKKNIGYLNNSIKISKHFISTYNKIYNLVKHNHGKLYITYPVTIKNPDFDLSKNKSKNIIDNFENLLLKEAHIDIKCNAGLFNLNRTYFFNTHYHPNKYGALIRSENLGNCLNDVIKGTYKKSSFSNAIEKTKLLEEKYINIVKKPAIPHFETRFKDLLKIKIALKEYEKDNGTFPKSKEWDGLYTRWGYEGKDWIKGLIPKYLKELPRDPRLNNNKGQQYIYKSNGKDYKIISHSPEDCEIVKKTNLNMIDKKRDCWAYGFWTSGGESW